MKQKQRQRGQKISLEILPESIRNSIRSRKQKTKKKKSQKAKTGWIETIIKYFRVAEYWMKELMESIKRMGRKLSKIPTKLPCYQII